MTRITRRQCLAAFAALIPMPFFTSCGLPSSAARSPMLFLSPGIQGAPYYHLLIEGAQREATQRGAVVQIDAPVRWDGNLQTTIVDAAIAKQVDAIIIAPCDSQMLIAPLKNASDKGIQVVTVDTFLGTGDYTTGPVTFPLAYIGSDNVKGGRLLGEALIKTIGGKGTIYLQNNTPDASTARERAQGCKEAIAATNGAVTLVAEQFDEGDISKATAQTSAIMQAHPDLTAIFAADIYSAQGVVAAVNTAQKGGVIKVAQIDAPEAAIRDLRNGIVDLILAQKPFDMGRIAVDYAIDALHGNGKDLPKRVTTDFIVIDKNNVDTPEAQNAIYR